jgi:hypothetical protein
MDDPQIAGEAHCRAPYWQIGEMIMRVLDAAEQLEPAMLKVWIRIGALWLAEDVQGLAAEIARAQALIQDGKPVTAPALHS